ncbi:hypothetical protein [Marinigracilibium pacificum]|uniref:GRAM domain-containing protein n=1 Tax=Marinigracilibium pacificum TaxID=2729599 RepID=A0A848J1G8_9BACT|nr:hypothetical protein [Marinigracilibium pacificum]NMM48324.1 hypothetical protein [Marinigracilibium pacificum]
MIWDLFKSRFKFYNVDVDVVKNLLDNEYIIINGKSGYIRFGIVLLGELALTNKRLLFLHNGLEIKSIFLKNISSVKCSINKFKLKNGLLVASDDNVYKYTVDYPEDWENLIQYIINISN